LTIHQPPGTVTTRPRESEVRKLRLFADERSHKGRTPLEMSYVLQRGPLPPARDSVEPGGAVIVLHRNQPARFTIVNRTHEGTSVHWHGVELLSSADGVAGWSGLSKPLAPMIAPNDSFVANLRLPRAGTFIYHTHLNDIEQVTSGMYGALLVLPEGERYDPATDHSFVMGWDGPDGKPNILVNGDSLPKPVEMKFGKSHRMRFINIGPADRIFFAVRRDTTTLTWKPRAKDGADLPLRLHVPGPSIVRLNVGETFDADFDPPAPGEYRLTVGRPKTPMSWSQRIIVR
jgi:manganese oxidase